VKPFDPPGLAENEEKNNSQHQEVVKILQKNERGRQGRER